MAAPPTASSRSSCASPPELGGEEPGTNPEQLFAVGYASCFESALGAVARRRKLELGEVGIDSKVMLVTGEERSFTIAVELAVTPARGSTGEEAVDLVGAAHKVCPYSNATRGQHRGRAERQRRSRLRLARRRRRPPTRVAACAR